MASTKPAPTAVKVTVTTDAKTPPPAAKVPAKLAHGKTPAAPDATVDILDMWQTALDALYLVANAPAPVSTGVPPISLSKLAGRGLIEQAEGGYVLTSRGSALVRLLWDAPAEQPEPAKAAVKTAAKARTRKAAPSKTIAAESARLDEATAAAQAATE